LACSLTQTAADDDELDLSAEPAEPFAPFEPELLALLDPPLLAPDLSAALATGSAPKSVSAATATPSHHEETRFIFTSRTST
jgi:hypothetical protein